MNSVLKYLNASLPSILIGVGAALLAPVVLPILAGIARPVAKGVVKGALALKEFAAEAGEQVSDIVAEAKADRSTAQLPKGPEA